MVEGRRVYLWYSTLCTSGSLKITERSVTKVSDIQLFWSVVKRTQGDLSVNMTGYDEYRFWLLVVLVSSDLVMSTGDKNMSKFINLIIFILILNTVYL